MKKILLLFSETIKLIKNNKLYFFAPLIIMIILLAIFVFTVGPTAMITFIYAGI
jgi:hypothetical protein